MRFANSKVVMDYNVIITAYRNELKFLIKDLKAYGQFNRTSFRDVIVGTVIDINAFMSQLVINPPLSLARVMPVDKVINFTDPDELIKVLEAEVVKLKLKKSDSFRVTVERRGWKGVINSYEWAKKLGGLINDAKGNKVDLTNPSVEVVIEVMDKSCGLSLITRKMKADYFFVKT
ncbi:MAG: THUMP domain-containing protein [Candidatus Nanoarchaeia archaeon]|jgi:tRNA(Ser,Leu) C12 N-acetylase TAN1